MSTWKTFQYEFGNDPEFGYRLENDEFNNIRISYVEFNSKTRAFEARSGPPEIPLDQIDDLIKGLQTLRDMIQKGGSE